MKKDTLNAANDFITATLKGDEIKNNPELISAITGLIAVMQAEKGIF